MMFGEIINIAINYLNEIKDKPVLCLDSDMILFVYY